MENSNSVQNMKPVEFTKWFGDNEKFMSNQDKIEILTGLVDNNSYLKILLCFSVFKKYITDEHVLKSLDKGFLETFSALIGSSNIKINDEMFKKSMEMGNIVYFMTLFLETEKRNLNYCYGNLMKTMIDESNLDYLKYLLDNSKVLNENILYYAISNKKSEIVMYLLDKFSFLTKDVYHSLMENSLKDCIDLFESKVVNKEVLAEYKKKNIKITFSKADISDSTSDSNEIDYLKEIDEKMNEFDDFNDDYDFEFNSDCGFELPNYSLFSEDIDNNLDFDSDLDLENEFDEIHQTVSSLDALNLIIDSRLEKRKERKLISLFNEL